MLKRIIGMSIVCLSLTACASWFGSDSTPNNETNNPAVGSKQGSEALFGQSASAPVSASAPKAKMQAVTTM